VLSSSPLVSNDDDGEGEERHVRSTRQRQIRGRGALFREELAALLREQYGFPVSKNRLDKEGHYGTAPEPAGSFGKFLLYTDTEEAGLKWAKARFRSRASVSATRSRAAERRKPP
jgi:hypothetical protein